MEQAVQKVKISEKRRGTLVSLTTLNEGYTRGFDGTKIFYHSIGKGQPPIVCCNGLGVGTFFWVYLERMFRTKHQIVTWDYRGHGRSELKDNPNHHNLQSLVKDCKAVLDKLNLKKAVLVGHSLGVQVILEVYRKWPERVAGLVCAFGTYEHPMNYFYNSRLSRHFFELCYILGITFPRQGNWISRLLLKNPLSFWMGGLLKIMNTGMIHKEDCDRYINHILSVDPLFFTMLLKSAQDHSAEDILRNIKVPTLIITGDQDQFTPTWISKKMHRLIPDSELFSMHNTTHAGLVEQPDLVNLRIEKFIQERVL